MLAVLAVVAAVTLVGGLIVLRTFPPLATVMSSSMEPAIGVGDIVVLKAEDNPEVGDVVRFDVGLEAQQKAGYPSQVLHRVISVDREARTFRTQGDNMANPDPFQVPYDAIEGRVVWRIPQAGRLLGFFVSPFGLLWLAIATFVLVVLPFYDLHREGKELDVAELLAIEQLSEKVGELEETTVQRVVVVPEVVPRPDDEVEPDDEVKEVLHELVGAVGEYGAHLRSHTAILRSMSDAAQELSSVTSLLREQLSVRAADPAPPPGTPELLARLSEAAIDGRGVADPQELAIVVGIPTVEVEAGLAALAGAGLVSFEPLAHGRVAYRLR